MRVLEHVEDPLGDMSIPNLWPCEIQESATGTWDALGNTMTNEWIGGMIIK